MNTKRSFWAMALITLMAPGAAMAEGLALPKDDWPECTDLAWLDDHRLLCAWGDGSLTLHDADVVDADGRLKALDTIRVTAYRKARLRIGVVPGAAPPTIKPTRGPAST